MGSRLYADWVDACANAYGADSPIPEEFRRWAAMAAVSGVLGRKCYYNHGNFVIRPNLFVLLCGLPGSGKSTAMNVPIDECYHWLTEPIDVEKWEKDEARPHWQGLLGREVPPLRLMKDSATPEKLAKVMSESGHYWIDLKVQDSNMMLVTDEFGTFMSKTNTYLHTFLTKAWDCSRTLEYYTKNKQNHITKGPYLTWLAGATPQQFIQHMPANAAEQGLLSRLIIVFYNGPKMKTGLSSTPIREQTVKWLKEDLGHIAQLEGPFTWSQEAEDAANAWVDEGCPPPVLDPMMQEYDVRRLAHLIKASMVLSAARRETRTIELQDWQDAQSMIFSVERKMPSVLKLFGMSDAGRYVEHLRDYLQQKGGRCKENELRREAVRLSKSIPEASNAIEFMETVGMVRKTDKLMELLDYD